MKIEFDNCVYMTHPLYDLYASDEKANIIHINKKILSRGNQAHNGYFKISVRGYCQSGFKSIYVHRFVWECFYGIIPEGKVIDHINNEKDDNRLCNLQLLSHQDNCKKSAKKRDYSFVANNCKNRRCVMATNKVTNQVTFFKSMYAIKQHLGINAGIVKMVCENTNKCKSGVSKINQERYVFKYIDEKNMPENFKKSANIRPHKFTQEEKKQNQRKSIKNWQNKEFTCPNCKETLKNSNKYNHKKKCWNDTQKK